MPNPKRIGMVIGIKPEAIEYYKSIHADTYSGVRDLLSKYNMKNFSIFLHKLPDDKHYLFGYFEYDGTDYEGDMAKLAAEPRDQEWHAITDDLQIPLPGEKLWASMEEVYHNK
jgi:L-rhamnose mutarotase